MSKIDNHFQIRDNSNLYRSPDIVSWGPAEMSNPSTYLIDEWNRDVGKNPTQDEVNYIYVRTQNLTSSSQSTRIYLYVVIGGQLFTSPGRWTQLSAANGKDYVEVTADAHGKVVAPAAFRWNVPANGPNHNCFIAIASNSGNPLPDGFANNQAFYDWVRNNQGVAWRNISLQPASSAARVQKHLPFENLNPGPALFGFWVEVSGPLLHGDPEITVQCAEQGPNPPINWSDPETSTLYNESTLPGHFQGILDVTVTLPSAYGDTWPAGVTVLTKYYAVTGGTNGGPTRQIMMGAFTVQG